MQTADYYLEQKYECNQTTNRKNWSRL